MELKRIRILNDADFNGWLDWNFPKEVWARKLENHLWEVPRSELNRVGYDPKDGEGKIQERHFFEGSECEVVE